MPLVADHAAKRTDGRIKAVPMAAVKIWKGALVNVRAGYAQPAAATAGDIFCGVSYEQLDNSAGAAGAKNIRVQKLGEYEMNVSGGMAATDLGKEVYITDDNNVQLAAPANPIKCGRVAERVSNTVCRIRIDGYTA